VAGRPYAFPYSPLFFLPFTPLVPDRAAVEEGLKHAALLAAALEVLAVYALARQMGMSGLWAALVSAFLPPLYSRLSLAMFATTAGHLLDTITIVWAARLVHGRGGRRPWIVAFALTLSSLLTYVSSLFNLSAFWTALAALRRPLAKRALAVLAAAAGLAVVLLYLPFTILFVREIAPAVLSGGGATAAAPASGTQVVPTGLLPALARIPLFYGYAVPLLALAGLMVLRRRAGAAWPVMAAYGIAFLVLVALRAFGAGLFKDLKEVEFVAPLMAVAAGATLEVLAERGLSGRLSAALVAIGVAALGLAKALGYAAATIRIPGP
jgi:hypothetical protein